VSGEERAEVRRRRHSSHQDGGEREGEDRKRRSLLDVFGQLIARCCVPGAAEEDVGNGVPVLGLLGLLGSVLNVKG
jgi:hypothetical protein